MGTGRRLPGRVASEAPGPAAYVTDKDFKTASPRAIFSRAAKHSMRISDDVPGPGKYPVKSCLGQGPRAVLLSRRLVACPDNEKPGPATYTLQPSRDPLAYSFGLKTELPRAKLNTPGPGAYSPTHREVSPRAVYFPGRFGRSGRNIGVSRTVEEPGPGAYVAANSHRKGIQFSFTRAIRDLRSQTPTQLPGPGAYDQPTTLVHPATAASLTPRRSTIKMADTLPGPGAYTPVPNRAASPAFSIAKSPKAEPSRSLTPSPAAYTPTPQLKASPSYGIGTGKRETTRQWNDSPGPGSYTPKLPQDSPKFSMKMKLQSGWKKEVVPGPGHYSPSNSQILTKAKTPVIGTEPKLPMTMDTQQPSPGSYTVTSTPAGPRFTFGRSQRSDLRKDESPGPGQYTLPPTIANVPSYLLKQ